jgi:tetratricopeptide (TPR) repeat protein
MMSKQEKQDNKNAKPAADAAAGKAKTKPWEFHARYLDLLRESLKADGEKAYERWGISLFHCLSDEEIEAQRQELGFDVKDALDFYNRGCLLASREDYAQACQFFAKALEAEPELPEARFNYALCLEKSGEMDKARAAWQVYLDQYAVAEEVEDVKQHLGSLASV